MKILVTNDDGVHARGLWVLAEALAHLGKVTVVAPDREQSGVGSSITLTAPLRVNKLPFTMSGVDTYSVEGTPGDSVIVALSSILEDGCDLVVAGVNQGHNTANEIFISGTIGAALHGRFRGLPAISCSVFQLDSTQHDIAAKLVALMVRKQAEGLVPTDTLLNVNVPNCSLPEIEGISLTRLALRNFADVVEGQENRGRKVLWLQRKRTNVDVGEGTDFHALLNRRISITPLDNHLSCLPAPAIAPEVLTTLFQELKAQE
ncbi:MAG: 5'/3'-nucleotidase SurE [Chloroflexi bacterium]|nr:5'/3'-nucleotidase SurE [Chloroflexota bacterium]